MSNPTWWEEYRALINPVMIADSPVIDKHDCTCEPTEAYEWDLLLSEEL